MIKQVIIIRKDLKMRKGKEIAQGSHASMAFLCDHMKNNVLLTEDAQYWLDNKFTKICLQVESESDLLDVYNKAKESGLTSYLITDSGLTEFHNVPTNTCIAIGPNKSEDIDKITGHLKLY